MSRQRTSRFKILRKLGEGSIGIVYEAHDREQDMRVALKMLRRLVPAGLYRLKQEFRALRSLRHPNIVTLYELVSEHGSWFITMELIEGEDFVAYVRKEGVETEAVPQVIADSMQAPAEPDTPVFAEVVDESRLRHVLSQMALALHAMHLAGLVHRDLKPSNVRVTELGRAVLMDFSIVAEAQHAMDDSGSGNFMLGTPYYMAPEQAAGDPPSAAVDWYALGVMTYQAITGRLPFEGLWDQVLLDKQELDPPRPGELVRKIPPDLEELCLALLSRHPHDRPGGEEVLRRLGQASDDAANVLQGMGEGSFVGRENELDLLHRAYREATRGECVGVSIHGAAGMGKSKLLGRLSSQLVEVPGEPVIVLSGRCHPRDRRCYNAFDEIIDALSRALLELPRDRLTAILPEGMELLPWMFPAFLRVPGIDSAPRSAAVHPRELRDRAADALRELLARLASWRTLVLCIDDVQWADADSVALLCDLVRSPAPGRVLLLLASDCPADPAEPDLLDRLDVSRAHRVELTELPEEVQRQLVDQWLGGRAPAFAASVLMPAAGSPLFLSELVRSAVETRTSLCDVASGASVPSLDEVLGQRIHRLPASSRALLEVVALAGEPAPLTLLADAADQRINELERASATLRAARLVRITRPGREPWLTAYHHKVREVVQAALPEDRRRELHHRLALAHQRSGNAASDVLAHHWRAAGEAEQALLYTRSAAHSAAERLAFERAAELYEAALDVGAGNVGAPGAGYRPELLRSLGDVLSLAGCNLRAAEVYEQAAGEVDDGDGLALACLAAEHRVRGGQVQAGVDALARIAAELGAPVARTRKGIEAASRWRRMRLRLRGKRYKARSESEIAARDLERLDALYSAAVCLGMIDPVRGALLQAQHLLIALRHGEPSRIERATACELPLLAGRGGRHLDRADELARELVAEGERRGDAHLTGLAHLGAGVTSFAAGRYQSAEASLARAIHCFAHGVARVHWELSAARYVHCLARLGQGQLAAAAPVITRALEQAQRACDIASQTLFACQPNMWRLMRLDRVDEALALIDEVHGAWPAEAAGLALVLADSARAMGHLYGGDAERAARAVSSCMGNLRSVPLSWIPMVMSDIHALAGRAALVRGDDAACARVARKLARMPDVQAQGHAALLRASLARRAGRGDEAAEHARVAICKFDDCGAVHYTMSAKFRLGHMSGEDHGAALISEATAWCEREGIANVERMFDYLFPWTLGSSNVQGPPGARAG